MTTNTKIVHIAKFRAVRKPDINAVMFSINNVYYEDQPIKGK